MKEGEKGGKSEEKMPGVDFDIVRSASWLIKFIDEAIQYRLIGTRVMMEAKWGAKQLIDGYAQAYPHTVSLILRSPPGKKFKYAGSRLP